MKKFKYDFSGYATKNNLKCTDGRVIKHNAFKDNDGATVPLVWQHLHSSPDNVLGHAMLENREDGVYAYGSFNSTEMGQHVKSLVQHGDITAMSIFANNLKQKGCDVIHGAIKEVSLVLAPANPGAIIDNLSIQHSDGSFHNSDEEAIIYADTTISLAHADDDTEGSNAEESDLDVEAIFDSFTEEQKQVVYAMLAAVTESEEDEEETPETSETEEENPENNIEHSEGGNQTMKKNIFENKQTASNTQALAHADVMAIFADAVNGGTSLKESMLAHGITDIGLLFPEAQKILNTPDLIKRDTTWVDMFLGATKKTPFSRIKTVAATLTANEARAKGYIKGNQKMEEVFPLLKRETTPQTVYKKQKLDRDDIIDITDMDVVAFLKMEMRIMLDEEIARAGLVGDGRAVDAEDKINATNIRPIYGDADLFTIKEKVSVPSDATNAEKTELYIETILRARKNYKGSGNLVFFTTSDVVTTMLLAKDTTGRRLYSNEAELCAALRVKSIVEVPVMEGMGRVDGTDNLTLVGILVDPKDYTYGADKGGAVSMFDDFDIDFNQYKYLIEARTSGCLTKPYSAITLEQKIVTIAG